MGGAGLDFTVIWTNITYFFIGRFPHGPLGGIALTLYLAVVACVLSFFGGLDTGYAQYLSQPGGQMGIAWDRQHHQGYASS